MFQMRLESGNVERMAYSRELSDDTPILCFRVKAAVLFIPYFFTKLSY